MKTLAFIFGLLIAAFAAAGLIAPSGLNWIAEHAVTPRVFYFGAVVRIAMGLVLISAASASREPKAIRVLGYIILIAGIVTAFVGLLAIDRAHAIIAWWLKQGADGIRLTAFPMLVMGGFVAWACAPVRRA